MFDDGGFVVVRGLINVRFYVLHLLCAGTKLCSPPVSYASSEGKVNQQGTGSGVMARHGY